MTDRPTPEQALASIAETVYPLDVFPAPPLPLVAQVLKNAGLTIDALSAEIARQMLNRVARMGVEALERYGYVIVHPDGVPQSPYDATAIDRAYARGWNACRRHIFGSDE